MILINVSEWRKYYTEDGKFPFHISIDPNPGHNIEEFRPGQYVALGFTIYAKNFQKAKNTNETIDDNFKMQSIYLNRRWTPKKISTLSERKQGPDKWLIRPHQTIKTNVFTLELISCRLMQEWKDAEASRHLPVPG